MTKVSNSTVSLDGIRLFARHGVMTQERTVGGSFTLSLRMRCDIGRAMLTDSVADTVDYGRAATIAREVMDEPSLLLERVAYRIADRLLTEFPLISSVTVRLTKDVPPIGLDCDGATVEATFAR